MRNFIALPHGPAHNRAGFKFVREVKDSTKNTRLIPFSYSTTQTFIIELGTGVIRFHTLGATLLYSTPAAYNGGTAYVIGDMCSSAGVNYYCIANTTGNAPPNATYWYALPASLIYEIPNPYAEADLFDIHYVQSADVMTLVHPSYPPKELKRLGATNWTLTSISFVSSMVAPAGVAATPTGTGSYAYSYVVTSVGENGIDESVVGTAGGCSNNLYTTGQFNTITWSAASGAQSYRVYKRMYGSGPYGFIGQTTTLNFVDDNIAADNGRTPPIANNPFSGAGNYPAAVSYFEQRRCFAGTNNKTQNMWLTKTGTESSMDYAVPTRDDDAISFKIAAREANTIRHIVPLNSLILLTSAAEWRVNGGQSGTPVTPTSLSVKPQSYIGSNSVTPIVVNNNLIYASARGGHVRELGYSLNADGYVTGDLSLRATHLFDGYTITDMAYQKCPQPVCWFVSSNGKMLGMTYVPEQQVFSWSQHDTDGLFESCAVVAEGDEDFLYVVVKRTIGGATKRYIERMESRQFTLLKDAFFVDSGLTFNATVENYTRSGTTLTATTATAHGFTTGDRPTLYFDVQALDGTYTVTVVDTTHFTITTATSSSTPGTFQIGKSVFSGLSHLEGKTVSVLTDGAVHTPVVVTSGSITLTNTAIRVHAGLPYNADLKTLPVAQQIDGSFGQGHVKNVNNAWVRVSRSSGLFVGPDETRLVEAKQRTTELYGEPPNMVTDEVKVMVTPSWQNGGQIYIRQSYPLPITVVGLTLELVVGG